MTVPHSSTERAQLTMAHADESAINTGAMSHPPGWMEFPLTEEKNSSFG